MLETRKLVIQEITYLVAPLRDSMYVSVRSFSIDRPIAFRNNFIKVRWGCGRSHGYQDQVRLARLYATALLETDWSTIDEKIQVAEKGIRVRLHEFSMNHGGTPEENQAIEDALNGLNISRKDVAAWQGSKRTS
jgi:hypothetical protein